MSYISTYKILKSLKPIELYDIITGGYCSEYREEFKREVISLKGEWYLNNWHNNKIELDILCAYISDTGFTLYTTKEEAKRIEEEFKSWNLFTEVWSKWYGGKTYVVGFNYSYEAFSKLYLEYKRDKKINQLVNL